MSRGKLAVPIVLPPKGTYVHASGPDLENGDRPGLLASHQLTGPGEQEPPMLPTLPGC